MIGLNGQAINKIWVSQWVGCLYRMDTIQNTAGKFKKELPLRELPLRE